jgi:hypothetical protein
MLVGFPAEETFSFRHHEKPDPEASRFPVKLIQLQTEA